MLCRNEVVNTIKNSDDYKKAIKCPFNVVNHVQRNDNGFLVDIVKALHNVCGVETYQPCYIIGMSAIPHDDSGVWRDYYFLNYVLQSQHKLKFEFNKKRYDIILEEGECYILDTRKEHWAFPIDFDKQLDCLEPFILLNIPIKRNDLNKISKYLNGIEFDMKAVMEEKLS